jgi:MYXO-CTERM domain-containing protein
MVRPASAAPIRARSPRSAAGATEQPGFAIAVSVGSDTAHVDLAIDGVRVAAFGSPFTIAVPGDVTTGSHDFTLSAFDGDHNVQSASVNIDVSDGGCSTSGSPGGIALAMLGVGLVTARRRRRIFPLNM